MNSQNTPQTVYFSSGGYGYTTHVRIPANVFSQIKAIEAVRYMDREWLEDMSDYESTPGWYYRRESIDILLKHGIQVEIDNEQVINGDIEGAIARAEVRKEQQRKEYERRRRESLELENQSIALFKHQDGETPRNIQMPAGVQLKYDGGFDIRGGGVEFYVEADKKHVWKFINNSADGDNWSANNWKGTIATRFEITSEREAFIRRIAPDIDEQLSALKANTENYEQLTEGMVFFANTIGPLNWGPIGGNWENGDDYVFKAFDGGMMFRKNGVYAVPVHLLDELCKQTYAAMLKKLPPHLAAREVLYSKTEFALLIEDCIGGDVLREAALKQEWLVAKGYERHHGPSRADIPFLVLESEEPYDSQLAEGMAAAVGSMDYGRIYPHPDGRRFVLVLAGVSSLGSLGYWLDVSGITAEQAADALQRKKQLQAEQQHKRYVEKMLIKLAQLPRAADIVDVKKAVEMAEEEKREFGGGRSATLKRYDTVFGDGSAGVVFSVVEYWWATGEDAGDTERFYSDEPAAQAAYKKAVGEMKYVAPSSEED